MCNGEPHGVHFWHDIDMVIESRSKQIDKQHFDM
jgi:hypothetical protein